MVRATRQRSKEDDDDNGGQRGGQAESARKKPKRSKDDDDGHPGGLVASAKKQKRSKDVDNNNLGGQAASAAKKRNGILGYLTGLRTGLASPFDVAKSAGRVVALTDAAAFRVQRNLTPFDRRVTALCWHPVERNMVAVGSKGGDILLWNCEKEDYETLLMVQSPGGSIQDIKFDATNPLGVYTCSIDGTFALRTFREGQRNHAEGSKETFLDTRNRNRWYTSFDVDGTGFNALVGDSKGEVTALTCRGLEVAWTKRLHKNKVTSVSYSEREPFQFVTSSVDTTVKIWDLRSGLDRPLHDLVHDKAVNCAEYNHLGGSRLATTDQKNQIRIYSGPCWDLERIVDHPHRQFQHLTPVNAVWHPLVDLVVAGRYPDPKFPGYVPGEQRTVDFIDADTGETVLQLTDPATQNKIISLVRFSPSGDALLAGAGLSVLLWKKPAPTEPEKEKEKPSSLKQAKGRNDHDSWEKPAPRNAKKKSKNA